MIVFDLECINGHTFEGWFDDREDLDRQQSEGLLQCPVCESISVVPKLSPVAVRTSANTTQQAMQATHEAMAELTERVADYVEKNYENVGASFAKEALEMHYGAKDYRNIRGTTTKEEDKMLAKEGVNVIKVPVKKNTDDLN
ncbi:MAG: hypothetical protein CSA29_03835 [Desulfobacterales bacterium]|nr:MAG: hypothetical protein CSA29_03835 [Desulfobacterales bacterium]